MALEAADGEKKKKNHGYSEAMLFPISPGVAMTAQEIAEIADVTVMTVWNRYRSGLRGNELLKKRNISLSRRTAALCRPPAFYGATVTYFLYIYPVSPVLLTRTWYQFPQSERMVSRVPFLSLPRLL